MARRRSSVLEKDAGGGCHGFSASAVTGIIDACQNCFVWPPSSVTANTDEPGINTAERTALGSDPISRSSILLL
ncbi:hypothetical protein J1614_009898 [Plenodomus biglobosus]|nr:hypothetical protein J1614_009898 [Plenodomus biglobosus]